MVLRNARVAPFLSLYRSAMFLPALLKGARSLSNIYGFVRAFTCIFVDPFAFVGVGMGFVFTTKYVLKFGRGFEVCVYSSFG